MFGGDEIIFSGSYKDLELGVRFDLNGKRQGDVAHILSYLSSEIEPYAFRFSGIDTKGIDGFAKIDGKGVAAVCSFLEDRSSEWNRWIKGRLENPKLMPAAESYLFNTLLRKAGVSFKIGSETSAKPEKEEISDVIAFVGKYKDWVAIKKLGLGKVKDYEVSGILGGINFTAVNKAFDFAGIEKDDALVQRLTKGKRKSYGNAALCLKELGSADAYVVCKALETLGFRPYASSHMLTDAYPDIKPPKQRGRKPKG